MNINDGLNDFSVALKDIPIFLKKNIFNVKKSACIKTKNLWIDEEEKCYRYYVNLYILKNFNFKLKAFKNALPYN